MAIAEGLERLKTLAEQMRADIELGAASRAETLTVREFVGWFGYERRGDYILSQIRRGLEQNGLQVNGDYEVGWNGARITIVLQDDESDIDVGTSRLDPTIQVTVIESAHEKPQSVKPEAGLEEVITKIGMAKVDYLPVMPSDWKVEGIISWRSIAKNLSRRLNDGRANQVMDSTIRIVPEIPITAPLFSAMAPIEEHGFVLVRGEDNAITGLITATDFAQQYAQLARPYMMIGEIERSLRVLIRGKFNPSELNALRPDREDSDQIGPADLTFGEHVRLFENPKNWERLNLPFVDRKEFVRQLNWLRERRNEIMHFHPDGLDPEQVNGIERILKFVRNLM